LKMNKFTYSPNRPIEEIKKLNKKSRIVTEPYKYSTPQDFLDYCWKNHEEVMKKAATKIREELESPKKDTSIDDLYYEQILYNKQN